MVVERLHSGRIDGWKRDNGWKREKRLPTILQPVRPDCYRGGRGAPGTWRREDRLFDRECAAPADHASAVRGWSTAWRREK